MTHINTTFRIAFSIFCVMCISCSSTTKKENKPIEVTKSNVEDFTILNLPISGSCGDDLQVFDKDSIRQIIPELPGNLRFGGVIKRTRNFTALILLDTYADSQIPYLATITNNGKIIDKFKLFSEDCDEDEFYKTQANYTLDKTLKGTQTDNFETYKRDDEGEIIKESVVKNFHKYEFYVDPKGKIIK